MTCEQIQELLHAYIDGELDLVRNVEIERHVGECEVCEWEHQDILNLRTLVQSGAQYFSAPETLKSQIATERNLILCARLRLRRR